MDIVRRVWNLAELANQYPALKDAYYDAAVVSNKTINSTQICIDLHIPLGNKKIVILKTVSFKEWIDETRYKETNDEAYAVHNPTLTCTKYIAKPSSLMVYQSCNQENRMLSPPKFDWRRVEFDPEHIPSSTIVRVGSENVVQCFQGNITLVNGNTTTFPCPRKILAIPAEVDVILDDIQHKHWKTALKFNQEKEIIYNSTVALMDNPWDGHKKKILRNIDDFADNIGLMNNVKMTATVLYFKKDPLMEIMRLQIVGSMLNRTEAETAPKPSVSFWS